MNEFDRNILIVSENICKNIASITDGDRGFKSQNILSNLRHLVEAVDQRIFSEKATITLNKYDDIERSVAYVASRGELKFLNRFHYFLQAAVSHFIPDEDGATRLMLKYYEWLLRIREYVKNTFGLDILQNLEDYPLDQDESLNEYYEKIAYQLEHMRYSDRTPSDRFYVQKSKPFFSGGKIYYEITVIPADDYSSKFNRFTVFSKNEIPIYYAIKLNFIDTEIGILKRHMPIRVIDNYKVAIRPVEFDDFSRILNMPKVNAGTIEYDSMMEYLTVSGMSLTELVTMSDEYYGAVKTKIQNLSKSNNLFNSLDRCRQLIKSNAAGSIILRYILLKMRHRIMRYQIADRPNNWISYLSGTHQVYCVESGVDFNTGNFYVSKSGKNSSYFQNLPTDAQFGIMMALMYGWHEGKSSPVAGTNADDYAFATQTIIWEYQQQLRTSPSNRQSANGIDGDTYYYSLKGRPAEKCYDWILSQMSKHYTIPSFAARSQSNADTYTLKYNPDTKKYSLTLEDTNNTLSDIKFSASGISVTRSGNKYTFTSDKMITSPVTVGSKSNSSRYDDVNYIIKTIDESDYLSR